MGNYKPGIAIPTGETLIEVLEDRGYTVERFAEKAEMDVIEVQGIVKGNLPINEYIAKKFEQVLEIPFTFWLNLEESYQEARTRLHYIHSCPEMESFVELPKGENCPHCYLEYKE
jgi:HTH-type transcriptional regulator/antitoxin HigA